MLLNPSFKVMTSLANVARTTASTSKFKKDNKSHIFKHYTPPQHALTHIIPFVLK